jgi:hypothetical protein
MNVGQTTTVQCTGHANRESGRYRSLPATTRTKTTRQFNGIGGGAAASPPSHGEEFRCASSEAAHELPSTLLAVV